MAAVTRPFILAIDDDPGRYDGLRQMLGDRVRLEVVSCRGCVSRLLPECDAVLLDHDLCAEACTCGGWPDRESTREDTPAIAVCGVPVIVTSCSAHENRRWLTETLREHNVRVVQHSANEIQPEYHWIGWLWRQGVL